jgi:hypothetical protein
MGSAFGYTVPAAMSERDLAPLIAFFIIHTSSSRQPGNVLINLPGFKLPVQFFVLATAGRLRQFLRHYHTLAVQIMLATPQLRTSQAAFYGLHEELAVYAFDFVDLHQAQLTPIQLATLRNSLDRKLDGALSSEVYGDAFESELASFMDAPLTSKNGKGVKKPSPSG